MALGEEHEKRRKEDFAVARFIGEIAEWKKDSITWREETDEKLKTIIEFMEQVRTPRTIIIWTVRAVIVAAFGSIVTGIVAFVKGHIHWG